MTCQLMYVPIPMTFHTVPKWQSPSQLVQETKATYALALSSLAASVYDVTTCHHVSPRRHRSKMWQFVEPSKESLIIRNFKKTIGKP